MPAHSPLSPPLCSALESSPVPPVTTPQDSLPPVRCPLTASPTSERAQQPTKPPAEQSSRLYYSIAECHLPEALSSIRLTPFLRPGATPTAWSYEGESNYNPCMI